MSYPSVLVFGFSVVGETPGFVECAKARTGVADRHVLNKVGFGGLHLGHVKFLLPEVMADFPADLVILEFGTSGYRWANGQQAEQYAALLETVLNFLQAHGLAVALLDLPRVDVNTATDPILLQHLAICTRRGIPYRRVPLQAQLLYDGIHATAAGHTHYADELLNFIAEIDGLAPIPAATMPVASAEFPFDAVKIISLAAPAHERQPFARAGYRTEVVSVTPGHPIEVTAPAGSRVVGLSYIIGPRSGTLRISGKEKSVDVLAYDQRAYYQRMGMAVFGPMGTNRILIDQLPELPDIPLLKGQADRSERLGLIGHLFLRKDGGA